ncbi:hypothetical protein HY732_02180 [Candidatus Uhrbacteria bacterium]|nr:hypothetical protein [Candidatus Uhrbacteria bacterium]
MPWKRILLIIGFIVVVILLGALIWFFFFRPTPIAISPVPTPPTPSPLPIPGPYIPSPGPLPTPTPTPSPLPEQPQLPKTAEEAKGGPVQTTQIQPDANIAPARSSDGSNVVTFDSYTGTFHRIKPDGTSEQISDQTFSGATNVTWSPNADKAVIEFLDDTKVVYDFSGKKQIATLPKHWESFNFSPDGEKIAFKSIASDPDNRWLAIANADGSGGTPIEPLGKKSEQFTPLWSPSNQIIGLFEEGLDGNRKMLYFIGQNNENFKSVTVEGRDIQAQWSPLGTQLLYSGYSSRAGFRPELWIVDALGSTIGNNRRKFDIQTWAEKCTFANNETLYCSVPKTLPEGAGLLPIIAERDSTGEAIYKIDLTTGEKRKIAEPDAALILTNLVVSTDQQQLYFTDKYSKKLYTIQLQ